MKFLQVSCVTSWRNSIDHARFHTFIYINEHAGIQVVLCPYLATDETNSPVSIIVSTSEFSLFPFPPEQ